QFGYLGFGASKTFPRVTPGSMNPQASPKALVWLLRDVDTACWHCWSQVVKLPTSVGFGMVRVPLFRAVPLGMEPRRTMSAGLEILLWPPPPICHSPNAIVLLVPSRICWIPQTLPCDPT